jgi:hypothetical protein
MSIPIGRKSNSQLNLPQPSAQVQSQCADVTTTSWWLVMIGIGLQVYRSRDQGRRTTHAGVSARSQRTPLLVCALNRNATDGEQRCLWVQVGLAVSQTHFGTATGSPIDDVACLCPPSRSLLFGVYKHTQGVQGKVAVCARNRGRHTTQHWIDVGRQC